MALDAALPNDFTQRFASFDAKLNEKFSRADACMERGKREVAQFKSAAAPDSKTKFRVAPTSRFEKLEPDAPPTRRATAVLCNTLTEDDMMVMSTIELRDWLVDSCQLAGLTPDLVKSLTDQEITNCRDAAVACRSQHKEKGTKNPCSDFRPTRVVHRR